jgi:hypothetical protein
VTKYQEELASVLSHLLKFLAPIVLAACLQSALERQVLWKNMQERETHSRNVYGKHGGGTEEN